MSIQAEYIRPDNSMLLETGAVTAAQIAAFQLLRLPNPPNYPTNQNQFDSFFTPKTYVPADTPDGYGPLGTPIYGSIILGDPDLLDNKYTDAQGNQSSYKTIELDCAICTVDYNNKVVRTDIQGLPYSITEFMSSGDNDITITGIYNSTPGVAPMDFIIALSKLFSAGVSIPVQNYFLNAQNIYYIKIMPGSSLPQTEGGYATQTFTIKALSDVPMNSMLP